MNTEFNNGVNGNIWEVLGNAWEGVKTSVSSFFDGITNFFASLNCFSTLEEREFRIVNVDETAKIRSADLKVDREDISIPVKGMVQAVVDEKKLLEETEELIQKFKSVKPQQSVADRNELRVEVPKDKVIVLQGEGDEVENVVRAEVKIEENKNEVEEDSTLSDDLNSMFSNGPKETSSQKKKEQKRTEESAFLMKMNVDKAKMDGNEEQARLASKYDAKALEDYVLTLNVNTAKNKRAPSEAVKKESILIENDSPIKKTIKTGLVFVHGKDETSSLEKKEEKEGINLSDDMEDIFSGKHDAVKVEAEAEKVKPLDADHNRANIQKAIRSGNFVNGKDKPKKNPLLSSTRQQMVRGVRNRESMHGIRKADHVVKQQLGIQTEKNQALSLSSEKSKTDNVMTFAVKVEDKEFIINIAGVAKPKIDELIKVINGLSLKEQKELFEKSLSLLDLAEVQPTTQKLLESEPKHLELKNDALRVIAGPETQVYVLKEPNTNALKELDTNRKEKLLNDLLKEIEEIKEKRSLNSSESENISTSPRVEEVLTLEPNREKVVEELKSDVRELVNLVDGDKAFKSTFGKWNLSKDHVAWDEFKYELINNGSISELSLLQNAKEMMKFIDGRFEKNKIEKSSEITDLEKAIAMKIEGLKPVDRKSLSPLEVSREKTRDLLLWADGNADLKKSLGSFWGATRGYIFEPSRDNQNLMKFVKNLVMNDLSEETFLKERNEAAALIQKGITQKSLQVPEEIKEVLQEILAEETK